MFLAHGKVLAVEAASGGVINAILGTIVTTLLFHGANDIIVWGAHGIGFDIALSCFLPTLLMSLAIGSVIRGRLVKGKLAPVTWQGTRNPMVRSLLKSSLLRSFLMAIVLTIIFVPLTLAFLAAIGIQSFSFWGYLGFKACHAVILGMIIAPLVVMGALMARTLEQSSRA